MKKIMFNDKYGLTDAVLQGRKTMTRRVAGFNETERPCKKGRDKCLYCKHYDREIGCKWLMNYISYNVGEVVAVAQSYQTILDTVFGEDQQWKCGYMRDVEESHEKMWEDIKGRTNKMFVKADLMPYQIRITNIKAERLQEISDEDCVKEGVRYFLDYGQERIARFYIDTIPNYRPGEMITYDCAKDAFAALIDKVSGKGTWERNPWVFAYSFELVK